MGDRAAIPRTRAALDVFTLVAGPAPTNVAEDAFNSWLIERRANRASLLANDWKYDDVPRDAGAAWRRYFVRTTAIRLLERPRWAWVLTKTSAIAARGAASRSY